MGLGRAYPFYPVDRLDHNIADAREEIPKDTPVILLVFNN
jgi:hypothetical protein